MENEKEISIPARLKVSDKEIDISGSEAFVSEQIAKLSNLFNLFGEKIKMDTALSLGVPKEPRLLDSNFQPPPDFLDYELINNQGPKTRFENVIAINGNDFQVLVDIPGETLRQRMTNLILMYMFFKATEGKMTLSFTELRAVCEKHAVLDKKNFSRILHDQKRLFIINNDNKTLQAMLTVPGKRESQKLLESLDHI